MQQSRYPLDNYELEDRYRRESGRVFLTGTQALVRIPLMQRTLDRAAGLNTAGFISGYRGSPLATYDTELWRAASFLEESNVRFLPAVNEELAATAILGSQQVEGDPDKQVDGVFGMPGQRTQLTLHALCTYCFLSKRPGPDFTQKRKPGQTNQVDIFNEDALKSGTQKSSQTNRSFQWRTA